MEDYNLSDNVVDTLRENFTRVDDHGQLLQYFKKSPFSIFYGPTRSGKTHALKKVFDGVKGTIIYIRSSPVRWTSESGTIINKNADGKTFKQIHEVIESRSYKIKRGDTELNWVTIVFDDIQNLSTNNEGEFNTLVKLLACSGRHYKIRTIVLVQTYMKLDKAIRSQASSFFSLLPISDTYRNQIYRDYWRIFKTENDLVELEKLPQFSFLFKFENRTRFYGLP